ncbi:MAG: hypothetical protein HMLIMOIP_001603 [Candidatus Nitrosomirales archaeon]|jgi:hypothetical protein
MKQDSLVSMDAKTIHARSNKRRSGFGTVVSSLIMVVAVAMLGSVVLIWANSSLNVERTKIANDFETNSNLLRESFIIEDIWLYKSANSVNVTLRNLGDLAINATAVNITARDSTGNVACSGSPPCTQEVPLNGVMQSKETLSIKVDNIYWNHPSTKWLDITVTTERGTIEATYWRVRQ